MMCPVCGGENKQGAKFCVCCGSSLAVPEEEIKTTTPEEAVEEEVVETVAEEATEAMEEEAVEAAEEEAAEAAEEEAAEAAEEEAAEVAEEEAAEVAAEEAAEAAEEEAAEAAEEEEAEAAKEEAAEVAAEEAAEAVEEEAVVTAEEVAAAMEEAPPAVADEAPEVSEEAAPEAVEEKPKKSRKKLIIILSVILAVLLAAGAVLFIFRDKIFSKDEKDDKTDSEKVELKEESALAPSEKRFNELFNKNFSMFLEPYSSLFDRIGNIFTKTGAFSGELGIELGEDINDILGVDLPSDLSLTYDFNYDKSSGLALLELCLVSEKDTVISAEIILDTEELCLYVSVPELFDETIYISFEDLIPTGLMEEAMELLNDEEYLAAMELLMPDEDFAEDLCKKYLGLLAKIFADITWKEDVSLEVLSVKSKDLIAYNFNITEKSLFDALCAVVEEFTEDEELWGYVEEAYAGFYLLAEISGASVDKLYDPDEIGEILDGALYELSESFAEFAAGAEAEGISKNTIAEISVYVDKDDIFRAVELFADTGEDPEDEDERSEQKIRIFFGEAVNKDRAAYEFSISVDGENFYFAGGEGDIKDEAFTGEIIIEVEGKTFATFKLEEYDLAEGTGRIEYEIGEICLSVESVSKDDEMGYELSVSYDDQHLLTLCSDLQTEKVKKVKIPSDLVGILEIGDIELKAESFEELLRDAGIDVDEIVAALEELGIDIGGSSAPLPDDFEGYDEELFGYWENEDYDISFEFSKDGECIFAETDGRFGMHYDYAADGYTIFLFYEDEIHEIDYEIWRGDLYLYSYDEEIVLYRAEKSDEPADGEEIDDALVGYWQDSYDESIAMELRADGTGALIDEESEEDCYWYVSEDELVINMYGIDLAFEFELSGDELTLEIYDEVMLFVKQK